MAKSVAKATKVTKAEKVTKTEKAAKTTKATKTTKTIKATKVVNPMLKRVRSASWLAILELVLVGVLGILLLVNPEGIIKAIFYVVGICLMIKGVYKVMNYFAIHGKYDFYNNDLLYGIIALVFGVIAVVLWEQLGQMIGIAVGAWMIYSALVRMNAAIKMHTAGVKQWTYVLGLAAVMLAMGIYMVVSVGAVVAVVGWLMIVGAIVGIIDDVCFIRNFYVEE